MSGAGLIFVWSGVRGQSVECNVQLIGKLLAQIDVLFHVFGVTDVVGR